MFCVMPGGADVELLCEDFSVSRHLIEYIDEVQIFQDIGDFRTCQFVFPSLLLPFLLFSCLPYWEHITLLLLLLV